MTLTPNSQPLKEPDIRDFFKVYSELFEFTNAVCYSGKVN